MTTRRAPARHTAKATTPATTSQPGLTTNVRPSTSTSTFDAFATNTSIVNPAATAMSSIPTNTMSQTYPIRQEIHPHEATLGADTSNATDPITSRETPAPCAERVFG